MARWRVVDLFSGGGGMSYGFAAHANFAVVAAADAQLGKPSSPRGSLGCNRTYAANLGLTPVSVDLAAVDVAGLPEALGVTAPIDVLAACPPCTGFTRTNATNHLVDDARNSLVGRVAEFAEVLRPRIVLLENARELVGGNFAHHLAGLTAALERLGYAVHASTHVLTRFGLPQVRERAIVIAARSDITLHRLDELWEGYAVDLAALTVRRTIGHLPALAAGAVCPTDPDHAAPRFTAAATRGRIAAVPHDGGSWRDLWADPALHRHLTPAMRLLAARNKLGSHPDVYGRARWDAPMSTIKRECAHVGNGRYAHPDQDRLLSVREMALLNGFPASYRFSAASLANRYRHVGDAVPPLISFQLAGLCAWMLGGVRPALAELLLPGTQLRASDLVRAKPAAA